MSTHMQRKEVTYVKEILMNNTTKNSSETELKQDKQCQYLVYDKPL
jgi:hypothetical protein